MPAALLDKPVAHSLGSKTYTGPVHTSHLARTEVVFRRFDPSLHKTRRPGLIRSEEISKTFKGYDSTTGEVFQVRPGCPNARRHLQWSSKPVVVPEPCGRISCTFCVFDNIRRWTSALALTQPSGMVTLTLSGSDSETISHRMGRFRQFTRTKITGWQDCWTAEPYRTDTHVHAWFTGPVPDASDLQGPARSAKLGSDITVVAHDPQRAVHGQRLDYAFKCATDADPDYRSAFLDINSHRLAHPSRGFFRDGPTGPVIPGGIDAVSTLLRSRSTDPRQPLRVVRLVR